MENIIIYNMVVAGCYQGIIRVTCNYEDEVVCQIGEHWFYFGYDKNVSDMNLFDYINNNTPTTIINDIFKGLEEIREAIENGNDEMEDEYNYYYWYLVENIH